VLKTMESFSRGMAGWLKREISKNTKRKLGALLARNAFRAISRRIDPDGQGGAPLLGLNGIVIKAHGSARERAIMNAIRIGAQAVQQHINEIIQTEVARATARLAEAKT
jgi:glycerol-3-phosphate acyltransferase PlsX